MVIHSAPALDSAHTALHGTDLALTSGDPAAVFEHLDQLRTGLDRFECAYLRHLNDTRHSWNEIGTLTGRGKQGAFNRYKRLMK